MVGFWEKRKLEKLSKLSKEDLIKCFRRRLDMLIEDEIGASKEYRAYVRINSDFAELASDEKSHAEFLKGLKKRIEALEKKQEREEE